MLVPRSAVLLTFAGNTNYKVITTYTDSGKAVDIAKATLTISADTDTKTYDGTTTSTAAPTVSGCRAATQSRA